MPHGTVSSIGIAASLTGSVTGGFSEGEWIIAFLVIGVMLFIAFK